MLVKGATVAIVRTIIPFPVLHTQLGSTFPNLISNSILHIEFKKDGSSKAATSTDFWNRLIGPPKLEPYPINRTVGIPPMGPYISTCSWAAIPHRDPPAYHGKLSPCWFQIKLVLYK